MMGWGGDGVEYDGVGVGMGSNLMGSGLGWGPKGFHGVGTVSDLDPMSLASQKVG